MRRFVQILLSAVLLALALSSGSLLLLRRNSYAACEKQLAAARSMMDDCGLAAEEAAGRTAGEDGAVPAPENSGTAEQTAAKLPGELFGRILIPRLGTDLPVMMPPKEDPEKYLTRDFLGNDAAYGSVYADPATGLQADCLVLYGHHMKNGAMFGNIGTLTGRDTVMILTPGEKRKYEVVAVFSVTPGEAAAAALPICSEKEAELITAQARKTGALYREPSVSRRHLALVTCEYRRPDERLIVLCEEREEEN